MNPAFSKWYCLVNTSFWRKVVGFLLLALTFAAADAQKTSQEAREAGNASSTENTKNGQTVSHQNLITIQEGQIPILLSAPHGGQQPILGADPRKGAGLEAGPNGFRTMRDVNTDKLALALSAALEVKTGKKPYLIVAKFARRYVDVNRPSSIGYEDLNAKAVYETYHANLTRFCADIQRKWGKGLLLDIHGQGAKRDTIFRGTGDGKSVSLLAERYGIKARSGPESFAGLAAAKGLKVFPKDDSKEQSGYTGGYITLTYGSRKYGMDAMQLEFGGDYTNKDGRQETANKLAETIIEFAARYLPAASLRKDASEESNGRNVKPSLGTGL